VSIFTLLKIIQAGVDTFNKTKCIEEWAPNLERSKLQTMRKYRLVAKKGEGTFSEVIKAQNIKTGTLHAIKCMKSSYKSADQVR